LREREALQRFLACSEATVRPLLADAHIRICLSASGTGPKTIRLHAQTGLNPHVDTEERNKRFMAIPEQSIVVGLFDDHAQAEQAVNALHDAGFRDDQITFSGHGASSGGILADLKSLFSGQGTSESVYNDLLDMGMPEEDARYYQQEYEAGRNIVAVTGDSRTQEAAPILARYGGYGPTRRSAQTTDMDTTTTTAQAPVTDTEGEQRIQLREEQLQVYKRPVRTGEVGLRKEVVSEQKTLNVPINREEVYIERRPIEQPVPAETPISDQDQIIRVPVSEERVNVDKQAIVREEVELGKRIVQDTEQVRDTVRHEQAHLEREGNVPIHRTNTDPFHPTSVDPEDLLEDQKLQG
jgi:uncharacterized protein (TIGR02271 family)